MFPLFTWLLSLLLGIIVVPRLTFKVAPFSQIFYIVALGIILQTGLLYFSCLLFGFPTGIGFGNVLTVVLIIAGIYTGPKKLSFYLPNLKSLFLEKGLMILLVVIGILLFMLFDTHILQNKNGDLYTGESTYGDLPFHLTTISQIAYSYIFPPTNPFYESQKLVYPFLINFHSAILVYQGWGERDTLIITGMILSLALIGLVYDFSFAISGKKSVAFLATLLYLFNGGLGFYFFLKDYSFDLTAIFNILKTPTQMIDYSHVFRENIQWGNFLSRMIVPERSLLFGIPAGIIILRLLFFTGHEFKFNKLNLVVSAFLLSLMPLLHTHTVLSFVFIFPILFLLTLEKKNLKEQFIFYSLLTALTVILALPHLNLFLGHIQGSPSFMKLHLWWMKGEGENPIWFWFKNSFLYLPLSLLSLLIIKSSNFKIKILQLCAFFLFALINIALFSPYDWDNVKFLFWAGLFFAIGSASVLVYFYQKYNFVLKALVIFIVITMISSAALSIYREINLQYVLFNKESTLVGKVIKENTPQNSIFLTYKIHNSPINNLAGRKIVMGYPGLLWTHGIEYGPTEQKVNAIYRGDGNALALIKELNISYIVRESSVPEDLTINQEFLDQFPIFLKTQNYTIYQVN